MSDGASCRSYELNRSIGSDAMQSEVGLTMWKSMASRRWKSAERSALGQDYVRTVGLASAKMLVVWSMPP